MNRGSMGRLVDVALAEAERYAGRTSPNPPVAAIGLDALGQVIGISAHERAGSPHAEIRLFNQLADKGVLEKLHTLFVTLEPCNHQGRTPPCTQSIIQNNVRRVIVGTRDPNPRVQGRGVEKLREAGIEVTLLEGEDERRCARLIEPFAYWSRTGRPWIRIKKAINEEGSMIPPSGSKTFTSPESLRYAHELRRRSDAIITGSGTIEADRPLFTVRWVEDFKDKKRDLVILDRRERVGNEYFQQVEENGMRPYRSKSLSDAMAYLSQQNAVEVLVEAGPSLTQAMIEENLWNEIVVIEKGDPDRIHVYRNH